VPGRLILDRSFGSQRLTKSEPTVFSVKHT
jgi:hypothetical protein